MYRVIIFYIFLTDYVDLLEAVPGLLYAEVKVPLPSYVLCDKL